MRYILFFIIVFTITACHKYSKEQSANHIFAYIDSIPVYGSEVDKLIGQELYDELCRIYLIRETALNNLIKDKLLLRESEKLSITTDSLINRYHQKRVKKSFTSLCEKYNNYLKQSECNKLIFNSFDDSIMFYKVIKQDSKEELCNNLYKQHNIDIRLKAPISPQLDLKYDVVHYRGNMNAKVTCMEISDLDCPNCKVINPIIDSLYNKYKDKVRFGFTHYGSFASVSAIASEAAGKQNKFWEMHDRLIQLSYPVTDLNEIYAIAVRLDLNMDLFKKDLQDKKISERIMDSMEKIETSGIYGTPTIAVNNRILFNSLSFSEIERLLLEELKK